MSTHWKAAFGMASIAFGIGVLVVSLVTLMNQPEENTGTMPPGPVTRVGVVPPPEKVFQVEIQGRLNQTTRSTGERECFIASDLPSGAVVISTLLLSECVREFEISGREVK